MRRAYPYCNMILKQILLCLSIVLDNTQGLICKSDISCKSVSLLSARCVVYDADVIVTFTVMNQISERKCSYNKPIDFTDGVYGYENNILWVDWGCQATFKVCYLAKASSITTSRPKSTFSPLTQYNRITTPTVSGHNSSTSTFRTHLSSVSTAESEEMDMTSESRTLSFTTRDESLTTESDFSDVHVPGSCAMSIVAIAGPLCLVIAVAIAAGICMWRKRRLRDNLSQENNDENDQPTSNTYSNNCRELQDPLKISHTYSNIENGTYNLNSRTNALEQRNTSAGTSTLENNYIPMDGHVTGGEVLVIGSNYYNFDSRNVISKQCYENISSKYVTMERPANLTSDSNGYLNVVSL